MEVTDSNLLEIMRARSIDFVKGPKLSLRLVELFDAEYIFSLRKNPEYSTHLSQVVGTVTDQQDWIQSYKNRETIGTELYYVIERHDRVKCGLVRLYDIDAESFNWGSWILDHNKPPKAALESALLSFGVGFDILGLTRANVDVRIQNKHATNFYRRLGMTESYRTSRDIFFNYTRDRYQDDRDKLFLILSECPKN